MKQVIKLPCSKCEAVSQEIRQLRQELLDFASLIELELDFAEEDVDFADRKSL